jgi:hypothetical protein
MATEIAHYRLCGWSRRGASEANSADASTPITALQASASVTADGS